MLGKRIGERRSQKDFSLIQPLEKYNFTSPNPSTPLQENDHTNNKLAMDKKNAKARKRSAIRQQDFWGRVRRDNKNMEYLISSVVKLSFDYRPYASVTIDNKNILGLLDTGAQISCLGGE